MAHYTSREDYNAHVAETETALVEVSAGANGEGKRKPMKMDAKLPIKRPGGRRKRMANPVDIAKASALVGYIRAGYSRKQAFGMAYPESNVKQPAAAARRVLADIEDWQGEPFIEKLEAYGLGQDRVAAEIDKRLGADRELAYQGELTGAKVPDNATRMQATQLLARLHQPSIDQQPGGVGVEARIVVAAKLTVEEWSGKHAE